MASIVVPEHGSAAPLSDPDRSLKEPFASTSIESGSISGELSITLRVRLLFAMCRSEWPTSDSAPNGSLGEGCGVSDLLSAECRTRLVPGGCRAFQAFHSSMAGWVTFVSSS